jgi:hypothetical protein
MIYKKRTLKAPVLQRFNRAFFWGISLLLLGIWMGIAQAGVPERIVRVFIEGSAAVAKADEAGLRQALLQGVVAQLPSPWGLEIWGFDQQIYPLYDSENKRISALKDSRPLADLGSSLAWIHQQGSLPKNREELWVIVSYTAGNVSSDPLVARASQEYMRQVLTPFLEKNKVKVMALGWASSPSSTALCRLLGADKRSRCFLQESDSVPTEIVDFITETIQSWSQGIEQQHYEHALRIEKDEGPLTLFVYNDRVRLKSPKGEVSSLSHKKRGDLWWTESGKTWITMQSPMEGEWILEGDLPKRQPYQIYRDMGLRVSPVDKHYMVGEEIPVSVELLAGDKLMSDVEFLEPVSVYMGRGVINDGIVDDVQEYPGIRLERGGDLRYTGKMVLKERASSKKDGVWIRVVGPTFILEHNASLDVHPRAFRWQQRLKTLRFQSTRYMFTVIPIVDFLDPRKTLVRVTINNRRKVRASYNKKEGHWQFPLTAENRDQPLKIEIKIRAKTKEGRTIYESLPSFLLIPPQEDQIPVKTLEVIRYIPTPAASMHLEKAVGKKYTVFFFIILLFEILLLGILFKIMDRYVAAKNRALGEHLDLWK